MGIAVFSPRLNEFFNSARGTEFCNRLFQRYPCGVFDNIFRKQLSDKSESPKSSTTGTGTPVSDSDWDAARSTGTVCPSVPVVASHFLFLAVVRTLGP
jgi:hypothetical protein